MGSDSGDIAATIAICYSLLSHPDGKPQSMIDIKTCVGFDMPS
jgi:hypothetical protein